MTFEEKKLNLLLCFYRLNKFMILSILNKHSEDIRYIVEHIVVEIQGLLCDEFEPITIVSQEGTECYYISSMFSQAFKFIINYYDYEQPESKKEEYNRFNQILDVIAEEIKNYQED